jgi:hypothetical protein
MVTLRGLPVLGADLSDGTHRVPILLDRVKGAVLEPAYVHVQNGEIVSYGPQPHVPIWSREQQA